jgi:MFS family permease
VAPAFGLASDRLGRRSTLCAMRAVYAALAATIMGLALAGALAPPHVFAVAVLAGLVRPSDLVLRNALIGDTIPARALMSAMAISRTTMDSARIAGALAGAGLFAQLGLGPAYVVVAALYLASLALTLGVSRHRPETEAARRSARPGASWSAAWATSGRCRRCWRSCGWRSSST